MQEPENVGRLQKKEKMILPHSFRIARMSTESVLRTKEKKLGRGSFWGKTYTRSSQQKKKKKNNFV